MTTNNYAELKSMYPYIHAMGKIMGSFEYYIINQMIRAKEDNAPAHSVYYSETTKNWVTITDIPNTELLSQLYKQNEEI